MCMRNSVLFRGLERGETAIVYRVERYERYSGERVDFWRGHKWFDFDTVSDAEEFIQRESNSYSYSISERQCWNPNWWEKYRLGVLNENRYDRGNFNTYQYIKHYE